MPKQVRTICPYCGVGCGVIASKQDGAWTVKGDETHPSNYGRLCSKGAALAETIDLSGRLLHPIVHNQQVSWVNAVHQVATNFQRCIDEHGADSVAFYVSGQLLTEDYYVANKLMKGYIGTANIDTNSRLCMSSTVAGYKRAFGSDTVPCCYEDLERAKMIVLIGSNAAWCHPVLFQRIVQSKKDNPDLFVVVIDPRKTNSCDIADMHLAINSGTDVMLFNGLLAYLDEHDEENAMFVENFTEGWEEALRSAKQSTKSIEFVSQYCGLPEEDVSEFYRLFARTERVVSVFSQGVNQSSAGTDKVNAIINCHLITGRIGRPGMGPFSFTGQTNAMGGREVGGLSNTLATHLEINNPSHRDIAQRFWQSPFIAEQDGYKAVELFEAIHQGKIKAVWIMCTNPVVSLPNADYVRSALEKCEFVVVSECVQQTDTTAYADVLLPALPWAEKEGTCTSSERRISRQRAFLPPAGEAKADWQIICDVTQAMGYDGFAFNSAHEVFDEFARMSAFENQDSRDFNIEALAGISQEEYDDLKPMQWPVTNAMPQGNERMFANGRFYTASAKAQLIPVSPNLPKNQTTETYPFVLNTGRARDQWHTMTRTGKSPRLAEHSPEPYAEMHPDDVKSIGSNENALVRVSSLWGEVIVRVQQDVGQKPGNIFVPIHWNKQYALNGCIDVVVNPEVDPLSGQPEFKHTPVKVTPYTPAWHGFILTRRDLVLNDTSYWVRARGKGFCRYELAGEQAPGDWPAWARMLLCASDHDVNWVEYLDVASRQYRGVRLVDNKIESCIFIAPTHQLPARNWLASLFAKDTLSDEERSSLLAGKSLSGQKDHGKIVCACFGVGENTLIDAIMLDKLDSTEFIGDKLKAGTNCGSCIPELKSLIAKHGQ